MNHNYSLAQGKTTTDISETRLTVAFIGILKRIKIKHVCYDGGKWWNIQRFKITREKKGQRNGPKSHIYIQVAQSNTGLLTSKSSLNSMEFSCNAHELYCNPWWKSGPSEH